MPDRYAPREVHLLEVSAEEKALILALRADPDQERHVVDFDGDEITVRHPISERSTGTLFDCPALGYAEDRIVERDLDPGRYRMSEDISGALERIDT